LHPLFSIGDSFRKGNQKFQIQEDLKHILFKPTKDLHLMLEVSDSRKKILKKLFIAQEGKVFPITYRLSIRLHLALL